MTPWVSLFVGIDFLMTSLYRSFKGFLIGIPPPKKYSLPYFCGATLYLHHNLYRTSQALIAGLKGSIELIRVSTGAPENPKGAMIDIVETKVGQRLQSNQSAAGGKNCVL